MSNIVIIGAGPIGSYTANKLALSGHKITVLEKKVSPEVNVCCTGIISKSCYDLLRPLSIENLAFRNANKATFITPSSQNINFMRKENVSYIVNRPLLNTKLAETAQNLGVEYIYSANASTILPSSKNIDIIFSRNSKNHTISADVLIIASGLNRCLCRQIGLGTIKEYIIGAQAQVSINNTEDVEIYLDHKIAPGGFAWLVPTTGNNALAGLITGSKPKQNLNNLLHKLRNEGKIAVENNKINFGLIPQKPLIKTYSNRILAIGSAAGQVKPITGGGIYFGLLCADIAVDILNKAAVTNNFTSLMLKQYQINWHKLLLNELKVGNLAQKIWSGFNNNHIELLINIFNKSNIQKYVNTVDNFQFDYHSKLLLNTLLSLLSFANRK